MTTTGVLVVAEEETIVGIAAVTIEEVGTGAVIGTTSVITGELLFVLFVFKRQTLIEKERHTLITVNNFISFPFRSRSRSFSPRRRSRGSPTYSPLRRSFSPRSNY